MATAQSEPAEPAGEFVGRRVGRFLIQKMLGSGGMGEVFLAEDTVLHREVAVKRLSPKLRADGDARRQILKEAQRASALSSPHIASVYDVVEDENELLLVMEYVEGEPLRHKIRAAGAMPLRAFLPIAIECAEALSAAHSRGIAHRDIKPENIMLTTAGLVKVLDFGLARQLRLVDESSATASLVSSTSNYAGTPGYMAPEVLREEPADTRADIFSLGVVFYEMLTGEHPFRSSKAVLTLDRVLHEEPKPLGQAVPGCPVELERIVSKMLAKNPAERYATAADLVVDLRALQKGAQAPGQTRRLPLRTRILTAVAAALAVAAAVLLLPVGTGKSPTFTERDWVLISDFENSAGDPIFDQTLGEALNISLQQSSYVNVLPRERVYAALERMKQSDATRVDEALGREISQRENVQVLLAGSIQRSGEAFQIRVRALEARSGRLLFAEEQRFTRKEELFERVDAVAKAVRRQLGESLPQIQKSSRPLEKVTTQSLEALQLYTRGVDDLARARIESAAARLQAALALDPDFAMAHYKLSLVYQTLGNRNKEIEEVEKAYALRERVTERERYFIGAEYFGVHRREAQAAAVLEILVDLYPDDADAQYELAATHSSLGKHDLAVADLRRVLRLNPFFAEGYASLVLRLAYTNANEEALQIYSQAMSHGVASPRLEWGRAMALLNADRLVEARQVLGAIENESGYGNIARVYLARADMYEGKFNEAARRLDSDLRLDVRTGNRSPEVLRRYLLARVYLVLDRQAQAIEQLKRIEAAGEPAEFQSKELRWVGTAYAEMGDLRGARRAARRLENLSKEGTDPYDNNSLLSLTAEIELAESRAAEASDKFQKALAAMPSSWAHAGLARAYARQQNWQAARDEWQKVIDEKGEIMRDGCSADWVLSHLEMARVYRQLGDLRQARSQYQAFLRSWANGDDVAVRRQAMQELQELDHQ
ncbi:MAG: protein kinase [Acidobacteriia bacterium]|nr:protein kinase [Terriglobia bacterium]